MNKYCRTTRCKCIAGGNKEKFQNNQSYSATPSGLKSLFKTVYYNSSNPFRVALSCQIISSLKITTGLGALARVSGGRAAGRATKTAGNLAGQLNIAFGCWRLAFGYLNQRGDFPVCSRLTLTLLQLSAVIAAVGG